MNLSKNNCNSILYQVLSSSITCQPPLSSFSIIYKFLASYIHFQHHLYIFSILYQVLASYLLHTLSSVSLLYQFSATSINFLASSLECCHHISSVSIIIQELQSIIHLKKRKRQLVPFWPSCIDKRYCRRRKCNIVRIGKSKISRSKVFFAEVSKPEHIYCKYL